jgi:hypothetical protein
VDSWRGLVKKMGIEYKVRLLLPHAGAQLGANEFFIAWQWWYTDAEAQTSNQQLTQAATCDSGAVYRSTD